MEKKYKLFLGDSRKLPDFIIQDGKEWNIFPGARNILKILRMIQDDNVAPTHKSLLLTKWFFVKDIPPRPNEAFRNFINIGEINEDDDSDDPRDFDYEQDALEIVSSFYQLYGLDLLGADGDIHWWKFRALLTGCFCVDCALSCKIRLRKADPEKADSSTREAIRRVQLDDKESYEERKMSELIGERLKNGQSIDDLL